jgi:arylsulfatase A
MVRGAKGNTISDGVHVPLLISWPSKIKKAAVFHGLIEFSDFFPTLADLVGREVETDGQSFLPLLEGKDYRERETVSVHYDPRWSENVNRYRNTFVQNMDYKLYLDGSFFHLEEDILEKKPLKQEELQASQREIFTQLQEVLKTATAAK